MAVFFYGIGLGNHYTMFVVGPLFALFVLLTNPDNKKYCEPMSIAAVSLYCHGC